MSKIWPLATPKPLNESSLRTGPHSRLRRQHIVDSHPKIQTFNAVVTREIDKMRLFSPYCFQTAQRCQTATNYDHKFSSFFTSEQNTNIPLGHTTCTMHMQSNVQPVNLVNRGIHFSTYNCFYIAWSNTARRMQCSNALNYVVGCVGHT